MTLSNVMVIHASGKPNFKKAFSEWRPTVSGVVYKVSNVITTRDSETFLLVVWHASSSWSQRKMLWWKA